MIKLKEIAILNDPVLSAGSGLVSYENSFYIVADDELTLYSLDHNLESKGQIHGIFAGELPEDYKARKKVKPDIEALVVVKDKILLVPSGSKENRHKGALYSPADKTSRILSFQHVYSELTKEFPELNIEGAVILDQKLRLFQRGNGKRKDNAFIDLSLESFLKDEIKDLSITRIKLGFIDETELSFTDATFHQDKIYFLAAGEKAESTYDDGEFAGAAIGIMEIDGSVSGMWELDIPSKPEGICIVKDNFYIVTDDDERKNPSRIFTGGLSSLFINQK